VNNSIHRAFQLENVVTVQFGARSCVWWLQKMSPGYIAASYFKLQAPRFSKKDLPWRKNIIAFALTFNVYRPRYKQPEPQSGYFSDSCPKSRDKSPKNISNTSTRYLKYLSAAFRRVIDIFWSCASLLNLHALFVPIALPEICKLAGKAKSSETVSQAGLSR